MEFDEGIVTSEAEERREREQLSVVATFGILAATIAATLAGSLAALASVHADSANSARLSWATYSNELLLAQNQYASAAGESTNVRVEDAWRAQFLEDLAGESTDPLVRDELSSDSQAGGQPEAPAAPLPSFTSPAPAAWCRGLPQTWDCAYEVSTAYAATSLNDDRQERAFIACVSMLAIALFLFALSKMLSQPSMEILFLGLGALITLIAVGWMVAEPFVTSASQPSGAAIRAYEKGWQLEQKGDPTTRPSTVEAYLARATSEDSTFADAWQQLGEEELLAPPSGLNGPRCRTALSALTQASELRGAAEDVDRLAVGEVLCGNPSRALTLLHEAPKDSANVSAGSALALAELASGQSRAASTTLDRAVSGMEEQGGGVRGPVFTTYWFDQLLADVWGLAAGHDRPAHLAAFIQRMQHDESLATLADFGLPVPRPSPGASVGASVTDATSEFGTAVGMEPVQIELHYSNLRDGDVISVMWDQFSTVADTRLIPLTLTLPGTNVIVVGQPGAPPAGTGTFVIPAVDFVDSDSYVIDVSLDGVPSGEPQFVTIAPQPGAGPRPLPLAFTPAPTPAPSFGAGTAPAVPAPTTTTTTTTPYLPGSTVACPTTTTTTTTTTTIPGSPPYAVGSCSPECGCTT
jgi:hypothetical protein